MNRPALERMVAEQVEIAIKYEGYIKKAIGAGRTYESVGEETAPTNDRLSWN